MSAPGRDHARGRGDRAAGPSRRGGAPRGGGGRRGGAPPGPPPRNISPPAPPPRGAPPPPPRPARPPPPHPRARGTPHAHRGAPQGGGAPLQRRVVNHAGPAEPAPARHAPPVPQVVQPAGRVRVGVHDDRDPLRLRPTAVLGVEVEPVRVRV